jgi:acyl transferase domain-containing protein/thioesterase domain-containing protein
MAHQDHENAVAITGISLRVPGASGVEAFWRNLREGVESIRPYTDEELLGAGESPERLRRSNYVRAGAPLEGMEMFDGDLFGFSPKECAILDPQHRHFLEVAWEALEDAGHAPGGFDGPVGVFAGCGMGSYFYFNLCSNPHLVDSVGMFLLRHTGNDKDFMATRLSYALDLTGPSLNVQTACSTSLVAVHYAVQSLLARECDMALAGGSSIELPHRRGYLYQENEILSPDGHCHAFDHRAAGTVFGSGCGVVVLRRLVDALEDGDPIYAVLRSTAVNNDGARKAGYLAPSVDGQAAAVVEALSLAELSADAVGYLECHGTGTFLGDPIEIAAVSQAYRQSTEQKGFCRIGSVKSNLGHLDTAAGVVSLIKASLALHHGEIPPSLGYERPNPAIPFEQGPFRVCDQLTPWPRTAVPRRAGVNSLGVGGTNAHAILEESPVLAPSSEAGRPEQLLVLSAKARGSLDEASRRLAAHLRAHPEQPLADVAYTLHRGRRPLGKRRVVAASSHEEAARWLEGTDARRLFTHEASDGEGGVVFMFPGGGTQYAGMGRELYAREPVFRRHVDEGLDRLAPHVDHDLRDLMFGADREEQANAIFQRPSVQLPAILIVEVALAHLWRSWGVDPRAMIGHSMGENTAACVGGVMSFEDAIALVHLRGRLFDTVPAGGMLSVPLSPAELEPLLSEDLDLACVNGDALSVASGPVQALEALDARLRAQGIEGHRVAIDIAAHSRMLEPILDDFRSHLEGMALEPPRLPFVSNVTGEWITDEQACDPAYWVQHLRSTVRFADGLATLAEDPSRIYLEVGPGTALGSLARQHPRVPHDRVVSSLRHPRDTVGDVAHHLETFGRLWACGAQVDLGRLWEGERRRRVHLPTYSFAHRPYFVEPGQARREERSPLDKLTDMRDWGFEPVWRRCAPDERAASERTPTSWLVFVDDVGVGAGLAERLRGHGDEVITVHPGDTFAQRGSDAYVLSPERGLEGYQALIRELVSRGRAPSRILHLWLLTGEESFRPGSSFFHRNQERGFYSLLFLAQAMEGEGLPRPVHITVVSNGMQRVGAEPLLHPEKSTVLGPCQVIPRELSSVRCASVDVDLPPGPPSRPRWTFAHALARTPRSGPEVASVLDRLEEELLAEPVDDVIAWRGSKRWVRRYEACALDEAAHPSTATAPPEGEPWPGGAPPLRPRGVYLVTGGFGGIGGVVAETLARRCQARLVLVGRTPLPAREAWDAWVAEHGDADATSRRIALVRELEAQGAEVHPAAADVTNLEQMRALVRGATTRFGPIHGLVHAAGVVHDDLITMKDLSSVEEVFAPKVHGTLVLDEIFRGEPLDFMVLFSSTSTITAPAGQVDYVAANAFLNAYAEARADGPTRVLALQWGIWSEVGMAATALAHKDPSIRPPMVQSVRGPLFASRTTPTQGQIVLTSRLDAGSDWVVDEHRTEDGQALLPGTGYLELIAEALTELGESRAFAVQDLFFLRPLHVPDVGGGREIRTVLTRSEEGYRVQVQGRLDQPDGAAWQIHAEGHVSLLTLPARDPVDLHAIGERCQQRVDRDPAGLRTSQAAHLRFGPRWSVLKEVRWGHGEALAHLALPERWRSDLEDGYVLHPALLDVATGYALDLAGTYDAGRLWIPVSYRAVRVHGPLPAEIRSWVRSEGPAGDDADFASFDVVITDLEGHVRLELDGLVMHRTAGAMEPHQTAAANGRDLIRERPSAEAAALTPAEERLRSMLDRGIRPSEGAEAFVRALSGRRRPQLVVSSLDPTALKREAEQAPVIHGGVQFERPDLDCAYVEPRDDIERTLVGFWQELLGIERVGVQDSFFDLGGHSLIAVRLFARIKQTYRTEFPISALFEAPTIEACAGMIREALGERGDQGASPRLRYRHLVAMHPAQTRPNTPFFLVAGMFGNVLNLRHLAHLLGSDRPFYGLQAQGLYGDEPPHESFDEMAEAYLAEIRTVQPHGPYLLGGFSGGGVTAYEMARRLTDGGEQVALLVMLDTPVPALPEPNLRDRMAVQAEHLRRRGLAYVRDWAASRVSWEVERLRRRFRAPQVVEPETFHSEAIEAAFRRALDRYRVRPYPGDVTLFRPAQLPSFVVGPERMIDDKMQLIFPDNGWGPHVRRVEVYEVPGDHDSMVLEPNVRVLAAHLADCITRAERPPAVQAPVGSAEAAE